MKELEISAKTVEEATSQALAQLGLRLDQVEIEVICEGKPGGLLGIGAEAACIRVTENANRIPLEEQIVTCAQESLEAMLSYMDLDASVSCKCDNLVADGEERSEMPMVMDIEGEDLGILIGRRGQTLDCLQYITRLIVTRQTGFAVPMMLDVNGYKKRRYESLRILARHVAEQVEVNGKSLSLEPMSAYERRIVHLALSEHPHVTTESVGFGDARKVVVLPKHG
jgi:spoIIIJ-associated protein